MVAAVAALVADAEGDFDTAVKLSAMLNVLLLMMYRVLGTTSKRAISSGALTTFSCTPSRSTTRCNMRS
jgi:hypothetical protein